MKHQQTVFIKVFIIRYKQLSTFNFHDYLDASGASGKFFSQ